MKCLLQILRANYVELHRTTSNYIELCQASISFLFAYIIRVKFNNNENNNNKHVTGDKLELTYLFQRLSIAIQRDNELCFNGTFVSRWYSQAIA